MSLPWRKRLDYRLLRWQARFESSAFDRSAPWAIAVLYAITLLLLALARSRELSQEQSLAEAMQAVWLVGDGFKPDASLLGHNYLFEQGGYLIYPVAVLADIFPTAITLMTIQSVALALGIVPLWRLARSVAHLRIGATIAIVVAYGAYSAIHAINLAGFHLEALALPALIGAVSAGYRGKWIRYGLFVAIALLARADLGLAIAGLGVLWFVEGKRRLGYATFGLGFLWTAALVLFVQPGYAGGDYPHVDAFAQYTDSGNPFGVLWGIVTSPVLFTQELFSQSNFSDVVRLLAPVLFLPVVAPRYLLPTVPLYCIYLVADVEPGELAEAGQNVPITAFVFVALVFALAKTGRVVVQRVNVDRRVIGALVLTAGVFFVANSVTSPYEEPWSWGRRDAVDLQRETAAEMIPADAVVRAAPKVLPLITERTGLFALDAPAEYEPDLAGQAVANVNWLVFDRTEVPAWQTLDLLDFRSQVVVTQGFVLVSALDEPIEVYTLCSEALRLDLEVFSARAVGGDADGQTRDVPCEA